MTDDLELLLTPRTPKAANRDELFAITTRILRRRALGNRVIKAASLIVVCLAFGLAGWLLKPQPAERIVMVEVSTPQAMPPIQTPAPAPPLPQVPMPEPSPPSLRDLEQQAELSDDKPTVARLYREAGDRYLNESQDYPQAARCYRLSLESADASARKVSQSDSWMLISMKTSLPKE